MTHPGEMRLTSILTFSMRPLILPSLTSSPSLLLSLPLPSFSLSHTYLLRDNLVHTTLHGTGG